MPNIGPMELAIVLIIALVIFGPKKLPELGSSLGRGLREFKSSISTDTQGDQRAGSGERAPALPERTEQAQAAPVAAAQAGDLQRGTS